LSPEQFCEQEVAAPGSAGHYALLNSSARARPLWVALLALHQTLSALIAPPMSPEVRPSKLGWWFDEIGRLEANRARHPVVQALQRLISDTQPVAAAIRSTLVQASAEPLRTADQAGAFSQMVGGELSCFGLRSAGVSDQASLGAMRSLGAGLQVLTLARTLQLPEWLSIVSTLLAAGTAMPATGRPAALPYLTLARIRQHEIPLIRRQLETGTSWPAWTPLRRLWVSWRVRRWHG